MVDTLKQIPVRVTTFERRQWKIWAAERDIRLNDLIVSAVREHMARERGKDALQSSK